MAYQCKNRAPYAESIKVRDGMLNSWAPRWVDMPFRMARNCVYSSSDLGQKDPQCHGCKWRAKEQE